MALGSFTFASGAGTTTCRAHPHRKLRDERTATTPKSHRFDWDEGQTRVNVTILANGEATSTAALEHARLADAKEAERMKAFWRARFASLKEVLER